MFPKRDGTKVPLRLKTDRYAPSLTAEVLPQTLQVFEKQCPGVRVTLHDLSNREMLQALREGRLDAALTAQTSPKQTRGFGP